MISERNITLLAALPRFRSNAPNDAVALERAALELVPEAKTLSRDRLYETLVHPALVELGTQKLRDASRTGAPIRATAVNSGTSGTGAARPRLDVSGQPGRNRFEKLLAHVKTTHPDAGHDRAFTIACDMNRTHEVIA